MAGTKFGSKETAAPTYYVISQIFQIGIFLSATQVMPCM